MSTCMSDEYYLRYVREHEDDIVSGLSAVNPEQFSKKLCQKLNLVCSLFNSLDIENTEQQLLTRYMVRAAYQKLQSDITLWDVFLQILSSFNEDTTKLIDKLRNIGMPVASGIDDSELNIALNIKDENLLAELLSKASHKWEEIAVCLGLEHHEREDGKKENNNKIRLCHVINCWLSNHSNTTLRKLGDTLRHDFVGETNLSLHIEEKIKMLKAPKDPKKSTEKAQSIDELDSSNGNPVITYISKTAVQVCEGKSTSLLVQATPSNFVSYQWKRSEAVLEDNTNYSGVHSNMLVVHQACLGVEGEYTCCVKNQENEAHCEKIALTVLFPPGKKKLLDLYLSKKEIPISQDSWPPVGSRKYINLALINSEHSTSCLNYAIRGNIDDINADKEEVKYEDIFKEYKSRELIMIEGRPGSGKTTLVHKIIKDWANGKALIGAKLVFLVVLRELDNQKTNNLSDLIKTFYYGEEESKLILKSIGDANGEQVGFIFDGLDEYNFKAKKKNVIFQLLDKDLLPPAMIIVSSRPSASKYIREDALSKRIEIIGFNKDQIMEYIDHFPFRGVNSKSNDSSNYQSIEGSLKDNLHSCPNIMDMCYLPVHTAMICYLYDSEGSSLLFTQTSVYEEFTRSIILRHMRTKNPEMQLTSLQNLSGEYQDYFNKKCKLAYNMTIYSKQILTSEDVICYLGCSQVLDDSHCLSLITVYHQVKKTGRTKLYSFLHLTLQEFLAAYYIAHQSSAKQMKIFKECSDASHMEMVWSFYCGLISFQEDMKQFKEVFLLKKRLMWFECNEKKLVRYAFESQQQVVYNSVTRAFDSKFVFVGILTPTDLLAIGHVICNTTLPVTELKINELHCDDNRINILLEKICEKKLSELQRLSICTPTTSEGIENLVRVLQSACNLYKLEINVLQISQEQTESLFHQLKNLKDLEYFTLSFSSTPSSIEMLFKNLQDLPSHISLYLSFKDVTIEGTQVIAKCLRVCCDLQLEKLSLTNCNIGYEIETTALSPANSDMGNNSANFLSVNNISSVHCLFYSLKSFAKLCEIDLSHNNIGTEGVETLATSFQHLTKLVKLDLSHNNIGCKEATCISNSFQYLHKLLRLNISHNKICSEGAASLSSSFQYLTELRELNLSHNNIESEGATHLANSFQFFKELWGLDISHNNIDSEGMKELARGLHHLVELIYIYCSHNCIDLEGVLFILRSLKECHELSTAIISMSEERKFGIVIHDLVNSENKSDIQDLVAAAQHKRKERQLDLGFTVITVPPKQLWSRIFK